MILFFGVDRSTNVLTHDSEVTDTRPIKQHSYRLNLRKLKVLMEKVEYILENGIIESSQIEWALPCILVDKPNGTTRFCTDYRRVNAVTKADCHPIPRMEDYID